jgi:hypothetical protein
MIMQWSNYIKFMQQPFPNMSTTNTKPTSPCNKDYNCIAWAYGRNDVWCEPDIKGQYFWPISNRAYTLKAYEDLFSSIGYKICSDEKYEDGFEKIALYVDDAGIPTHAARQLPTGKWTSKLGENIDIEHETPEILNEPGDGSGYGIVKIFMKRPRKAKTVV